MKNFDHDLQKLWDKNRHSVQVCSDAFKLIHEIEFPKVGFKSEKNEIKTLLLDSVRKTTVKFHYEGIDLVRKMQYN